MAEGSLSPYSDEFSLICGIVKKKMVLSWKSLDKRVSTRLLYQLKMASKKDLINFVSKAGTTLVSDQSEQSSTLLQPRSTPYLAPQYLAYSPGSNQIYSLGYPINQDESIRLANKVNLGREGGAVSIEKCKSGVEVTRLSAGALEKFNQEHGEPAPFGA